MDAAEINAFREMLIKEQKETKETLSSSKKSADTVELDQQRLGRLSRMDAIQSQAIAADAVNRLELKLEQIDNALQRIENGTFGTCISCKNEISSERLIAKPYSALCIQCASK